MVYTNKTQKKIHERNPMLQKQLLKFELSDEPTEITLEQAFAGDCGVVRLGKNGVALWTPGDDIPLDKEIVFDVRNRPLSEQDADNFKAALRGRFMNTRLALVSTTDPERIQSLLHYFNGILCPNKQIKNTPEDFRSHVFSYTSEIK